MTDHAGRIIAAAERQTSEQLGDQLRDALNALTEDAAADLTGERGKIIEALPRLASAPGAGFVALWIGGTVEDGWDPKPSLQPLLQTFLKWSALLDMEEEEEEDEAADPDAAPPSEPLWRTLIRYRSPQVLASPEPETDDAAFSETELLIVSGLNNVARAIVSHLVRVPDARQELAALDDLEIELARIDYFCDGALWIGETLRRESDELLVFHVMSNTAVLVRYWNISNTFVLFTLLQHEFAGLVPGARPARNDIIATLYGEDTTDTDDDAIWHFGQPTSPQPRFHASVWGEGPPSDIETIDGVRVLLLWPMILSSRTWNTSFFMPHIEQAPPSLEIVRTLGDQEVDVWRRRIGLS